MTYPSGHVYEGEYKDNMLNVNKIKNGALPLVAAELEVVAFAFAIGVLWLLLKLNAEPEMHQRGYVLL